MLLVPYMETGTFLCWQSVHRHRIDHTLHMTEHVLSAGVWKGEDKEALKKVFKAVLWRGRHFFYVEIFAYLHPFFFFKENKIIVNMPKPHSSNQLPYKNKIFKQCVSKININRDGRNKYMYPSYLVKTQKGTVPYWKAAMESQLKQQQFRASFSSVTHEEESQAAKNRFLIKEIYRTVFLIEKYRTFSSLLNNRG